MAIISVSKDGLSKKRLPASKSSLLEKKDNRCVFANIYLRIILLRSILPKLPNMAKIAKNANPHFIARNTLI